MPPSERPRYINVDELMPQVSLEQAAAYYGVLLPELHRTGKEVRTKCFLACGRATETGDRALAIQENDPFKRWACHQYSCPVKGGNLVSLCDLMKDGTPMGGRPRGDRFKSIARDLAAMVHGEELPSHRSSTNSSSKGSSSSEAITDDEPINIPLAQSPNERARELIHLDEHFLRPDRIGEMSPAAASYFRRRPFLDAETCQRYRIGYLPLSSKSLLRGKIIYPFLSAEGELLTWFGRDPLYEEKHRKWLASDRSESEPVKTQFVKGFHRGQELWGEHVVRSSEQFREKDSPIVVVEGPNDAIALHRHNIPAVALCSNTITVEQARRIEMLVQSQDEPSGKAILLLDNDVEGDNGTKQALPVLAERVPVQLGWSRNSTEYLNRQPESLSPEEIGRILRGG